MKFKSDIEVQAGLRDSSGALGASGQILSSTNGNVSWVASTVNTVARDVQNEVKAGVAINKGQAVYVTGADGTNIIVGLASNTSEATSSKTLGLLNATVAINGFADVVQIGRLAGLNTIGATVGDPVWLGTNGNLIYGLTNKPYAPAHLVFIGVVTRVNANNGEIFITVQNGFELNEIHDVDLKTTVPINGDILGYNGTLWVNKTIAGWLGYTPANASGTTNYVSKFTGSTTLGNSQIFDNGTNVGIGTSSPISLLHINTATTNPNALTVGNNNNGAIYGCTTSGNPIIGAFSGDLPIQFGYFSGGFNTSFTERMRIASSGNVLIGTTADLGYKLTVAGNGNSFNVITAGAGIDLYSTGNFAPHYQSDFSWYTGVPGAGTFRARLDANGNFGIGTASPSQKLEVNGTILSTDGSFGTLALGAISTRIEGNAATREMKFYTYNSEKMIIDGLGNVGIGTTLPGNKLQISDADSSDQLLRLSVQYNTIRSLRGGINWHDGGNTTGQISTEYDGTMVSMTFGSLYSSGYNSNTLMTIRGNGNVGIGTSSPVNKLEVNGRTLVNELQYTKAINISSTNLNDYTFAGFYNGESMTNAPNSGWFWVTVERYSGDDGWAHQTATSFGAGNTANEVYTRTKTGGTWTPWKTLTTSSDISGTTNYVSKFTGANSLGNSLIYDNGTNVGIGTTSSGVRFVNAGGPLASNPILGSGTVGSQALISENGLYGQYSGVSGSGDVWHQVQRNDGNTTPYNLLLQPSGGNVGIGTSSPTKRLDVVSSTNDSFDAIVVRPLNQTQTLNIGWQGISASLNFIVNAGASERMRITNTGNTGINTSIPETKLQIEDVTKVLTNNVAGVAQGTLSLASTDAQAANIGTSLLFGGNFITGNQTRIAYAAITGRKANGSSGNADGYLSFLTWRSTGLTEAMRITPAGYLGIGTTSPGAKLHVVGDTYVQSGALFTDTIGSYSTGSVTLWPSTKFIVPSESVGIGTTTPASSAALDITSTTQGFLPPRMDGTSRDNITSPAEGLIIWNTDIRTIEVFDGTNWQRVAFV